MSGEDYWAKRAERLLLAAERKGTELTRTTVGFYANTTTRLQSELDAFYQRYAVKEKITAAEAQKVLNPAERKSFDQALQHYLVETKRLGFGKEHAGYLRQLSGQAYVSRQQALLAQTRQQVGRMFLEERTALTGALQNVYPDAFARAMQDLRKGQGISGDFARMDTDTVNRLLRQGWLGDNYSGRIWKRKELLLSTLEDLIPRAFATGENSRVLGQQLADRLDVSRSAGERLARTEINYAANQSARLAYEQMGVDRYKYLATLDRRTSEICAALDGKVFWVEDARPGSNYPPMHPYCRSTTIPYFPLDEFDGESVRAARDRDGKYYTVPATMRYSDWKNTPESGMLGQTGLASIAITQAVIDGLTTPAIPGWSAQQNQTLNDRHQELLRLAQQQPVGVEVAAYMNDALEGMVSVVGGAGTVGIDLNIGAVYMHNHPSGMTFTLEDLERLLFRDNIKILSAVGNNGRVHVLAKSEDFNFSGISHAFQKATESQPNYAQNPDAYIRFMEKLLSQLKAQGLNYLKG